MENGGQNGVRTDQERDAKPNGMNGAKPEALQNGPEKSKAVLPDDRAGAVVNGGHVGSTPLDDPQQQQQPRTLETPRMNDLPDEIVHITQGFVPLSLLLTRLAQSTHNSLEDKVAEMAKMAVPAAALNGNAIHSANGTDDSSNENLRKKASLLNFAQDMHAKWVKALVITEWSRKSEMVSKLIDLKFHIDQQRILYDASLDNAVNVKRDLTFARMPSPDLKTALQVLSTGAAPWMPDLQYIEPPPLTAEEQVKWINDLNTLLSLRLNLEDFEKIPFHFRNYWIDSGRVTFKVPGEFEVDLTIADEDFEKQFWFIDFRFAFQPAAPSLPDTLRGYLEAYVNDVLNKDGLAGCYQFLHEFVLTHKLNELKRQALQLSRTSWTGTLMVEPLNRALAIQYWTSRTAVTGTKSWVLIAVHSGRKQNGKSSLKSSSYLVAKWYRDNKEIKDGAISLDVETLSAENLLRDVVGRHIEFLLASIHDKLRQAPRFRRRESGMALNISPSDPSASSLVMHIGYKETVTLLMEPTTGLFALKPPSKFTIQYEHQLNNGKNLADDGVSCLENVRCGFMEDGLNRRGSCMGWNVRKAPLSNDELKSAIKTRNWTRTIWLQRNGWGSNWFVLVLLSLSGDEWWLLEANRNGSSPALGFQARLPLNRGHPDLSDSFWNNLTLFATGFIVQSVDMRELHRHKIKSRHNSSRNWSLPQQVRLPSIDVALSGIFPSMVSSSPDRNSEAGWQAGIEVGDGELAAIVRPTSALDVLPKQPWANDNISIRFQGVQTPTVSSSLDRLESEPALICVSEAIIKVRRPTKFTSLKGGMVDRDVSYSPKSGEFRLHIRHDVGKPILGALKNKVKAVDRFVNFLESMGRARGTIQSELVTLGEVVFSYSEPPSQEVASNDTRRWRVSLDLSKDEIDIKLAKGNPHLKVVDLMQRLVNCEGGIEALMVWLPMSLPAMMAVDKMVGAWDEIQARKQGKVEFSTRKIDWMSIRYTVARGNRQPSRQLTLDVWIKVRKGEPWWLVTRPDAPPEDEFTAALKPVWNGKGEEWYGLVTGATGTPGSGIVRLLGAIDDAIRPLAGASDDGASTTDGMTTQTSNSQSMASFTQPTTQQSQASMGIKGGAQQPVVVLD